MNYGIINNRRSNDTKENTNFNQIKSMAKQMGIDHQKFDKEATNVWNMLEDLSQNDPKAYQEFIKSQLKDSNHINNNDKNKRYFIPEPNLVLKIFILISSSMNIKDPIIEDTLFIKKNPNYNKKKLFINLCTHKAVEIPINPNSNTPVPEDTYSVPTTDNLQIPLAVGKLRSYNEKLNNDLNMTTNNNEYYVIDVVFNPWIGKRIKWDKKFKLNVIKLALTWIEKDAFFINKTKPIKYDSSQPAKIIKSIYKGSNIYKIPGDIRSIEPVKFYIDNQKTSNSTDINNKSDIENEKIKDNNDMLSTKDSSKHLKKGKLNDVHDTIVIKTPEDLIKKVKNYDDLQTKKDDTNIFNISTESNTNIPVKQKKVLIEEISIQNTSKEDKIPNSNLNKNLKNEETKKKKPSVKKGFLNKINKKPLYPNGSKEGKPPSSYVKLMERSKVIDLTNSNDNSSISQINKDPLGLDEDTLKRESNMSKEKDFADYEFERLCMEADPDLKTKDKEQDDIFSNETFKMLAKTIEKNY